MFHLSYTKKVIAPRFQLGGIINQPQTCSACKKS
jgi:hypothetical protein